jgi:uncharacterized Zn finger protein
MAANTLANSTVTGAWWVRRWTKFMQQLGVTTDLTALRGLRVKRLEVQPGQLQAQVVERDNGVTFVEVRFPTMTDAQWEAIVDALGSQAIFVAQLLAGNMPAEIEQVFGSAGSWLLPDSAAELEQLCTPAGGENDICRWRLSPVERRLRAVGRNGGRRPVAALAAARARP